MKRKTKDFNQYLSHDLGDGADDTLDAWGDSLKLIGWVVTAFNTLEKMLDSAICQSINERTDSVGLLVIHGMQYNTKVDLYKRLCDDMHMCCGVSPLAYSNLIADLKEAARLRNLVVHADWQSTDADGYTYVRLNLTRGGMHQEYVQLTPDSLESIFDAITEMLMSFDNYLSSRAGVLAISDGSDPQGWWRRSHPRRPS